MILSDPLTGLRVTAQPVREDLLTHPVYGELLSVDHLRTFMEHHVFAVWDFMSLLKSLQCSLTCVQVPWRPVGDPVLRRLINEIVLAEESDCVASDGDSHSVQSHLELYLQAMAESGADTAPFNQFLARLGELGESPAPGAIVSLLEKCGAPAGVIPFIEKTFEIIGSGKPHEVASAFTLGREALIPDMFRQVVSTLARRFPGRFDTFLLYLDRHIDLDEGEHSHLAFQMLEKLCGESGSRWQEAELAAITSLQARLHLWTAISQAIHSSSH